MKKGYLIPTVLAIMLLAISCGSTTPEKPAITPNEQAYLTTVGD